MLRDTLARCRANLPLPELWKRLTHEGFNAKGHSKAFWRGERTESVSFREINGGWVFFDHGAHEGGGEVKLIELARAVQNEAAVRIYHELAGVEMESKKEEVESKKGSDFGRLVKVYDYRNTDGQLVHQTLRYEPKRFLQRRPSARGVRQGTRIAKCDRRTGEWWLWTLDGIEPVLYRLPELVACPLEQTVFLCEGEKDAEAIVALGGVATTAPMGAGKWRKSYTEFFKDRDVVIAADRDKAGQDHMERVAAALREVAKRVRVVRWEKLCPEMATDEGRKIDVSDFIAA